MADTKKKYIAVTSFRLPPPAMLLCKLDEPHVHKGTQFELDPMVKAEGELIALLNHAGRIGEATPENVKAIKAELAAEEAAAEQPEKAGGEKK